jgi:2-desacetyl-2-hydroxyethyl bacteriochlorophyllide A dehydrogenase
MRAVTYHGPKDVRVEDRPEPTLQNPHDALIKVEMTGICGSDLHIYRGRTPVDEGFTIGHEYVGTVLELGDAVTGVAVGDRVLGSFQTACGTCFMCRRGDYHKCDEARTFGMGKALGDLPGTQAEYAVVPNASLTLRRIPDGLGDEAALFAGDVMATGFHATVDVRGGDTVAVLGLGPVGLCAVQNAVAKGASQVFAVDTVADRLELAGKFGATPIHLTEGDPRGEVRAATSGRGVDLTIEAVGDPRALDLALKLTRKCGIVAVIGAYAEKIELNFALQWIKSVTLTCGHANIIGSMDSTLAMLLDGRVDPVPLVSHRMSLEEAPKGYEMFDNREALKIALLPAAS